MTQTIRVGSRGSALAMRQTEAIIAALRTYAPGVRFEIVQIVTHGDQFQQTPITAMGGEVERGIFNTALEGAVLGGEVDLATCSFKDVESQVPAGLVTLPVCEREDARDVLVSRHGTPLRDLPRGAVLGTSSPRRVSQLQAARADLRFEPLRGNVNTRVEQAAAQLDGIVLAAAGVIRLGLQAHITEFLDPEVLLPAPAQGAMGVEYLASREDVAQLVAPIRHVPTERCVLAEKALLVRLSGGCFAPVGVLATVAGDSLRLRCRIASLDGAQVVRAESEGPADDADTLVQRVADRIAEQGGIALVQQAREQLLGAAARS